MFEQNVKKDVPMLKGMNESVYMVWRNGVFRTDEDSEIFKK